MLFRQSISEDIACGSGYLGIREAGYSKWEHLPPMTIKSYSVLRSSDGSVSSIELARKVHIISPTKAFNDDRRRIMENCPVGIHE